MDYKQLMEVVEQTDKAIAAAKRLIGSGHGSCTVKCPVCGEDLAVHVSAYNGHTSGSCSTKGCLSWME